MESLIYILLVNLLFFFFLCSFNEAPPPLRPPFGLHPTGTPFAGPPRPSVLSNGPPVMPPGNIRIPPPNNANRPDFVPPTFPSGNRMNVPQGMDESVNKRMRFNQPNAMPQRFEQQMRNPLLAFDAPPHTAAAQRPRFPPFNASRMPPPAVSISCVQFII